MIGPFSGDQRHLSLAQELQALPARERLRFWEGRFGDIGENAPWTFEGIETYRVTKHPDLRRIIVAADPSGTKGGEDGGDHIGVVVVVGLGLDGADAPIWGLTEIFLRVVSSGSADWKSTRQHINDHDQPASYVPDGIGTRNSGARCARRSAGSGAAPAV